MKEISLLRSKFGFRSKQEPYTRQQLTARRRRPVACDVTTSSLQPSTIVIAALKASNAFEAAEEPSMAHESNCSETGTFFHLLLKCLGFLRDIPEDAEEWLLLILRACQVHLTLMLVISFKLDS